MVDLSRNRLIVPCPAVLCRDGDLMTALSVSVALLQAIQGLTIELERAGREGCFPVCAFFEEVIASFLGTVGASA